jgi:5-methylcytosine-specific restriction endonuclease McrA
MDRTTLAEEVDHIIPIRIRPDLAFVRRNLQPLCKPCHSRKTMMERRRRE